MYLIIFPSSPEIMYPSLLRNTEFVKAKPIGNEPVDNRHNANVLHQYYPNKTIKVSRSVFNMIQINALVCGIEIASSCAFTYIPPLLLKAGFTETVMTIILGIAPFVDLFTVPALAEWSDQCTSSIGRRRPFIVFLASILLLSLILIPCSARIATIFLGTPKNFIHMGILAIGVILLDYSYQALFNPCESLLSDLMATSEESNQTLAFTIYSACISLGCIIGYLIVFIDWTSIIHSDLSQTQISFLVTAIFLVPCLFLTLSNSEKPYFDSANIQLLESENNGSDIFLQNSSSFSNFSDGPNSKFGSPAKSVPSDYGYESGSSDLEGQFSLFDIKFKERPYSYIRNTLRTISWKVPTVEKSLNFLKNLSCKAIYILIFIPYKILSVPVGCFKRVKRSSYVIRRLFFVELFGWTGLICHNFFYSDYVGQYIYHGNPNAIENSTEALLYDQGVRMGSWGLFLHSLIACLYAFFLQEYFVRLLGPRIVFLGGLLGFSVGMILTVFSPSVYFLNVVTAFSGIGFAALTTTPNMLVTLYYQNKKLYMQNPIMDSDFMNLPTRGLAAEISILDSAYYLSQIILSICVGPIIDLTESALTYMVIAAIASFCAFYCGTKVIFNESQMKKLNRAKFQH